MGFFVVVVVVVVDWSGFILHVFCFVITFFYSKQLIKVAVGVRTLLAVSPKEQRVYGLAVGLVKLQGQAEVATQNFALLCSWGCWKSLWYQIRVFRLCYLPNRLRLV